MRETHRSARASDRRFARQPLGHDADEDRQDSPGTETPQMTAHTRLELHGAMEPGFEEVLTPDALEFVAERQRWVEITGPTERKMTINALNSGADGFMADFEDANAPTWRNMIEGHINLRDAIDGSITYEGSGGRYYELCEDPATLLIRPRGWHLDERHLLVGSEPVSGSLFDFGLYFFHCAPRLLAAGGGPYFYLPKLESHLEARLWNDVFCFAQDVVGIERGTIKATVLIETLPAAFEMDEILYELRQHSAGLNAGRWDYIFSAIKCFPDRPEMVLPNRADVTMTVPFMRAS